MPDERSPLPVQIEWDEGESGNGYLLRSALANGIGWKALMAYAGVSSPTWLRPSDVETLAVLAGTRPSTLMRVLRQRRISTGRREFTFLNHRWMSVDALRVRTLQVCPDCLRESQCCSAIWEIAAYCVCIRHRRLLIDRCSACRRPITWHRPAVDICTCKRYFASPKERAPVAPALLTWCGWLMTQCLLEPSRDDDKLLPAWLTQLGTDGAFQMAMAIGRRSATDERIAAADGIQVLAPPDMAACLMRAFDRASHMLAPGGSPRDFAALIDEARLERLMHHGVSPSARRAACWVYRRIRPLRRVNQVGQVMGNGRPPSGQLELFEYALSG